MDNVEANIIEILTENHLIPTGWTAYESRALNMGDKTLIVKQYGGQDSDTGVDYPRVQLSAYSQNPLTSRNTLQAIYNFFSLFFRGCSPYTKTYTGYEMQVTPLQSPFEIPIGEKEKLYNYAMNLEIIAVEQGLYLLTSPSGSFLVNPETGALLINPSGA